MLSGRLLYSAPGILRKIAVLAGKCRRTLLVGATTVKVVDLSDAVAPEPLRRGRVFQLFNLPGPTTSTSAFQTPASVAKIINSLRPGSRFRFQLDACFAPERE